MGSYPGTRGNQFSDKRHERDRRVQGNKPTQPHTAPKGSVTPPVGSKPVSEPNSLNILAFARVLLSWSPIKLSRAGKGWFDWTVKLLGFNWLDVQWTDAALLVWVTAANVLPDVGIRVLKFTTVTPDYYFKTLMALVVGVLGLVWFDKRGINMPVHLGVVVMTLMGAAHDVTNSTLVQGTPFGYVTAFVLIYKGFVEPALLKLKAGRAKPDMPVVPQAAPSSAAVGQEKTGDKIAETQQSTPPVLTREQIVAQEFENYRWGSDYVSQILQMVTDWPTHSREPISNSIRHRRQLLTGLLEEIQKLYNDLGAKVDYKRVVAERESGFTSVDWDGTWKRLIDILNHDKSELTKAVEKNKNEQLVTSLFDQGELENEAAASTDFVEQPVQQSISLDALELMSNGEQTTQMPPVSTPVPTKVKFSLPGPVYKALQTFSLELNGDEKGGMKFYGIIKGYFDGVEWPTVSPNEDADVCQLILETKRLYDNDRDKSNLRDLAHKAADNLDLNWTKVTAPR